MKRAWEISWEVLENAVPKTLSPEELEQALARFFDRPVPAVPYLLEHW